MSSHPPLSPELRDQLAAEHALGVLAGDELAEARRLQAEDVDFAADVSHWSARLAPMLDEVAPMTPPPRLLDAIEQQLGPRDNVISLRRRIRRWQVVSGGLSALAASLAMLLVLQPDSLTPAAPSPTRPPMVAMLEGGPNRLVATWDGDADLLVVPAVVAAADKSRSHELWMIPKGGEPQSMGVMPEGPMHLVVQPQTATMLAEGATFAVSLEPAGGSPTGAPTGAIIASGPLLRA